MVQLKRISDPTTPPKKIVDVHAARETPPRRQSTPEENARGEENSQRHKLAYAAQLFEEPFWRVDQVIAWIAFRKTEQFDADWRAAKRYESASLREQNPRETLRLALQRGKIAAIRDGRKLARDEWAGAGGRTWPVVHFRREDVLRLWPKDIPSVECAAISGSKEDFFEWMESEKRSHGSYPPTDRDKRQRMGWRQWAARKGVSRATVADWRKENPAFVRPRGRPK